MQIFKTLKKRILFLFLSCGVVCEYVSLNYSLGSKYMWQCKCCVSICISYIFVRWKKKFTSMAEFFSKLSKRQRNPVENFKTQSGRGGILLYQFDCHYFFRFKDKNIRFSFEMRLDVHFSRCRLPRQFQSWSWILLCQLEHRELE